VTDAPADSRADRYGRPAPWRRTAVVVGSALVGLLSLVWLAWTTLFHAAPDVSSRLIGWEVVDDHAATASVEVVIRDDDVTATCRVRAIAEDHTVVGEASFTPTEGRNEVELRTERRATAVENVGCTTTDQGRPR
jgi:hypothetical protein